MHSQLNRRSFVKGVAAGTCGGLIHRVFTPAGNWFAWASPTAQAFSSQPVFILVNMSGGASYNVAPLYDGAYRDKNPTISYGPENSIPLVAEQGLHPSLTSLKGVWDQGNLALLNMVGYPQPNRSHAESTDIWFRGARNGTGGVGGWAARMTCQLGQMFSGVSLNGSNLLTQGDCNPPRTLNGLDSLGEDNFYWSDDQSTWIRYTRDNMMLNHIIPPNEPFAYVKKQVDNVQASLELIKQETARTLPAVPNPLGQNPSGFQRDCRDAAKLLAATSLQVRFIYLERGGFDTHAGEKAGLKNNLDDMNIGLQYLIQAAQALGRWQDVVLVTMSEFSRTFENGSGGTDHGHAGPMFVMGGKVRGGLRSPTPTSLMTSSSDYYEDYFVDFRQIFKEIVGSMGLDANAVFPEQFAYTPVGLL